MPNIQEIYRKFLQQRCSSEEAELLADFLADKSNAAQIEQWLEQQLEQAQEFDVTPADKQAVHRNWQKLESTIRRPTPIKWLPRYWRAAVACMLFAVSGLSIYVLIIDRERDGAVITHQEPEIAPGGKKATLTLADGKSIALSDQHSGIVIGDAITYADGTAVAEADVSLVTLSTPRGGEYQVTLADGTKVWLNAASSLTYPSHFTGSHRGVSLRGEAYFEVAKTKDKPFIIRTGEQSIEVLGTKFNVQAYEESVHERTTLVEGSVRVTAKSQIVILKPGQQAQLRGQNLTAKKVNVGDYMAWKEGKFSFDNKPFDEVMAEVGRWYDLKIIYQSNVPKVELIGDAYRDDRLDLVLEMLELSAVKFKLNKMKRELIIY